MAKGKSTIASLVRTASKDEQEFATTVQEVVDEGDHERTAQFFDRLNIPRSVTTENPNDPAISFNVKDDQVGDFDAERSISNGIQKFMDRHERKLKWHAGHPSAEGAQNTILLVRAMVGTTDLRLKRLTLLLERKSQLTPAEWAIARELMNRSFIGFRNTLNVLATSWIEAMQQALPGDQLASVLGNFYEFIDANVRSLEEYREKIEERRLALSVVPDGFPPVKPPNYFGGDLLGKGPLKQFWAVVDARAHHFREAVG
jgi:hypothetical protein